MEAATDDDASGVDPQTAVGCGNLGAIEDDGRLCFYAADEPNRVVATIDHILDIYIDQEVLYLRLTLDSDFVDNTYGATAIGWDAMAEMMGMMEMRRMGPGKGGHTFKDLVGSDNARLKLKDANGTVLLDFKVDYITEDADPLSGFHSLGVRGGEGEILDGPADAVIDATSSLDRNLNERGYGDYTVDSPETDARYTANPAAPEWDFNVVYEAWIATDAFVGAPLHHVCIDEIHASPAKGGGNTKQVIPMPCPTDCMTGDCPSGGVPGDTGGSDTEEGGSDGECLLDPDISCDGGRIPPVP